LHFPLASLGRYAVKDTVTTPLPADPANFPVLAMPSTVYRTVVTNSNWQEPADSTFCTFVGAALTTTASFPAAVANVWCWPFAGGGPPPVLNEPVVRTGPVHVSGIVVLFATAAAPVTFPVNRSIPDIDVGLALTVAARLRAVVVEDEHAEIPAARSAAALSDMTVFMVPPEPGLVAVRRDRQAAAAEQFGSSGQFLGYVTYPPVLSQ
jgi:hypothetical protein